MKKIYLLLIVSFFMFILTGCGTNNPKAKVEEYMTRYTSISEDVQMDIDNTIASSGLSQSNQDKYKEVLSNQYKTIKYEVKDETIDGNNASVLVRVTVKDLYKTEQNSLDYLNNNSNEFYVNEAFNQEAYDTYRLNNMLNTTETIDYDLTFYVTKTNDTWVVQNPDSITISKIHGLFNYEN